MPRFTALGDSFVAGPGPARLAPAIDRVVGTCGTAGYEGDHGPATEAVLKRPYGIELSDDFLFVSDAGNNVIRAVRLP